MKIPPLFSWDAILASSYNEFICIVSTKNNGGFIQIRSKLKPEINSNDYKIYIKVYGNEKKYIYI